MENSFDRCENNKKPLITITDSVNYKYGFHCSKKPSIVETVDRITQDTPFSAAQIYISNSRSKIPPTFDYDDLLLSRKLIKNNDLYLVIHGTLLYNLAGTTEGIENDEYRKSLGSTIRCLASELDYGVMLGSGVIIHPGSCIDSAKGLRVISETITKVLTIKTVESEKIAKILNISQEDVLKKRKIILENAAGEGTKLCSTLEEINIVIKGVPEIYRNQIKVCIDTAHAYGRGIYDWGGDREIEKFYDDFERIIGLKYLEVFHLNDSMSDTSQKAKNAYYGSRKDRHEQLGCGYIFSDERLHKLKIFFNEARKRKINIIGEPPVSGKDDWNVICELLQNEEYPLVRIIR